MISLDIFWIVPSIGFTMYYFVFKIIAGITISKEDILIFVRGISSGDCILPVIFFL
jgi:hypothetical protein